MRALFLDIDGVLNSTETPVGEIEEQYARRLDHIVWQARPLYVVLSSTWRLIADLKRTVDQRFVIFGVTPDMGNGYTRGDEIEVYLDRHPQFTQYAILDDDTDFYGRQPFFHTPHGLTDEIAESVISHYTGKPPKPQGNSMTPMKKGIG